MGKLKVGDLVELIMVDEFDIMSGLGTGMEGIVIEVCGDGIPLVRFSIGESHYVLDSQLELIGEDNIDSLECGFKVGDKVRVIDGIVEGSDVPFGINEYMLDGEIKTIIDIREGYTENILIEVEEDEWSYHPSYLELVEESTVNGVDLLEINDSVDVIVDLYQKLSAAGMEDEYIVELIVNILD